MAAGVTSDPGVRALVVLIMICGVLPEVEASEKTVVTYTEVGVMEERVTSEHHRERREVTKDMRGFNTEEKRAMLVRHNKLRSERKAADMMYMEWDEKLAESAQKWAEQCIFEHSEGRTDFNGYPYVGENLYAGTHEFDPANVVQLWYNEVSDYSYQTMGCSNICGHYTQVVWASSAFVGCGVKYCPVLQSASFGGGYHVACHYGPGGNYVGQRPYALGEVCSKCSKNYQHCVQGLCSKRPMIGVPANEIAESGSKASLISPDKVQVVTALVISAILTHAMYR